MARSNRSSPNVEVVPVNTDTTLPSSPENNAQVERLISNEPAPHMGGVNNTDSTLPVSPDSTIVSG